MGTFKFLPILLFVLISDALAAEKVLFGEPAPIAAEGRQAADKDASTDANAKKSGRQARVFTFPGSSQNQDSRTHQPSYVISSPYENIEDRFSQGSAVSGVEDENRLLSLLPSFGGNGMQVGLDFKLPFFSVPYAKMFSALSSPSLTGNLFGGSSSPYGSSSAASALTSNLLGSGSGLSSGMATAAAMAVTAALLYPKVSGLFSLDGKGLSFRDASGAEDFLQNLNSVLGQFNIDGQACMKVALCSLGNAKRHQRTRARDPSGGSTPGDVVEDILNLPAVKGLLNKGGLVQARDFGGSGGDCDYFNAQKKCPISVETFNKYLSSLG